jgi:pimeloyl-ACP methyl ester carboxylesterase
MPTALIHGVNINYEVLGDQGPWVVLTPGGRNGMEGVRILGSRLTAAGYRVLLHDRRNCGASDVLIEGDKSEQEIWADDLYELLGRLDALPVIAGGGSAGCRLSLLLHLRHPGSVRMLLLWWVSGGPVAAERLGHNYYGQFIEAAQAGGMAAVCATDFFSERIAQNASNRERLMAMEPRHFIDVMTRWREFFWRSAHLPVIGVSEEQLRSIDLPACIVPGNDEVHPLAVGENAHRLIAGSELHYVLAPGDASPALSQEERQERLAEIFTGFLARSPAATP